MKKIRDLTPAKNNFFGVELPYNIRSKAWRAVWGFIQSFNEQLFVRFQHLFDGQVFIHYSNNDNQSVQYLNIDQPVLALSHGRFSQEEHQSAVAIGTASHLLVYHVSQNKIVFNKEVVVARV